MSDAENTTREKIKAALDEVLYDGAGGAINDSMNWPPYVEEVTDAVMAVLAVVPKSRTPEQNVVAALPAELRAEYVAQRLEETITDGFMRNPVASNRGDYGEGWRDALRAVPGGNA